MGKLNALTRGIVVFVMLAVLTAIEFGLARMEAAYVFLVIIAVIKGALVLWYFMHLPRVFKSEGGH